MSTLSARLALTLALLGSTQSVVLASPYAAGNAKPGFVRTALKTVNDRATRVLDKHVGKLAVLSTAASGSALVASVTAPSPAAKWAFAATVVITGVASAGLGVLKLANVVQGK